MKDTSQIVSKMVVDLNSNWKKTVVVLWTDEYLTNVSDMFNVVMQIHRWK